jgi:hypothetical protein
VGISPIFNIVDLYPYRTDEAGGEENQKEVQWVKQMPIAENPQMEKVIDQRVSKKTQRKTYLEYLVKWKGHLIEDASWESESNIQKHGQTSCRSSCIFQPEEYDAGASQARASGGQLDMHQCAFLRTFEI